MTARPGFRKCFVAVALGAVVIVALAACSGDGSSQQSASKSITVSVPSLPTVLSDSQGVTSLFARVGYLGTLVDSAPQPESDTTLDATKLTPDLATSYKLTPEGMVFTLRAAKASNGHVLSPEDVKYTYDRYVAMKDGLALFLMKYAGVDTKDPVTVIDDHTVRLNGEIKPLGQLAWQFFYFTILDSEVMKAHTTSSDPWAKKYLDTHSAGFGSYDVSYFKPSSQVTLKANPNYWNGVPAYTEVTVLARTEGASVSQLLTSGSVQWTSWAPAEDYNSLKNNGKFHNHISPQITQDVLELNQSFAPFKDAKVRQAMSLAVDRAAVLAGPYSGVGRASRTVGSQAIPALADVKGDYYTHDLAKAKQLMASSSHPNGFSFSMAYNPGSGSSVDYKTVAVTLQSFFKELGITLTPQPVTDPAQFKAGQSNGAYQSYFWGEGPIISDATYMMSLYHVKAGLSAYTGESDPQVNDLVAKAAETPLGAQRDALAKQSVELWNTKMYDIPVIDSAEPYIASTGVCGFGTYPYQTVLYRDLKPC